MEMTNEQKAIELACNKCACGYNIEEKKKCGHFIPVFEMAQWKDDEHAKEKQQWIERAAKWFSYRFPNMSKEALEKFKEDMKGE